MSEVEDQAIIPTPAGKGELLTECAARTGVWVHSHHPTSSPFTNGHFPLLLNFETKAQITSQTLSMKGQGFGIILDLQMREVKGTAEECCVCCYLWLDPRTTVLPMLQLKLDLPQKNGLHP